MTLPNRQGTKNARPAMRAEYGPHIKLILCHVPNELLIDKGMHAPRSSCTSWRTT